MAEQLHFNSGMSYETMLTAEHLVRYWLLREVCQGKRVLDVACGEGYGSSLLRSWGASQVVGIDFSHDAIACAKARFSAQGISYRVGDACKLDTVLAHTEQFDLIACHENLEHAPDVLGLLNGIRTHLAPGGSVVISCPNDPKIVPGHPNEFHLKTYTFEQFQASVTQVLGAPVQWQLGTPIIGFGIIDASDVWAHGQSQQLINVLGGADSAEGSFRPAQASHVVMAQTANFYLGVWGAPLPRTMVAAPIAHQTYVDTWNGWFNARAKNERLLAGKAEAVQLHDRQIQKQAPAWAAEREQMERALEASKANLIAYKRQLAVERSSRVQMAGKLYERVQQHQQALLERDAMAAQYHRTREQWAAAEAEKNSLNMRLHVLTSSRAHRATLLYYRLYEHGATKWFMRPLRRIAGGFWRLLKNR